LIWFLWTSIWWIIIFCSRSLYYLPYVNKYVSLYSYCVTNAVRAILHILTSFFLVIYMDCKCRLTLLLNTWNHQGLSVLSERPWHQDHEIRKWLSLFISKYFSFKYIYKKCSSKLAWIRSYAALKRQPIITSFIWVFYGRKELNGTKMVLIETQKPIAKWYLIARLMAFINVVIKQDSYQSSFVWSNKTVRLSLLSTTRQKSVVFSFYKVNFLILNMFSQAIYFNISDVNCISL
jgi:hypothetical protein